jgi:hypothetical protein
MPSIEVRPLFGIRSWCLSTSLLKELRTSDKLFKFFLEKLRSIGGRPLEDIDKGGK